MRPRAAKLSGAVQATIGERLRAMYDQMVKDQLPDRHCELLEHLQENKAATGMGLSPTRGTAAGP